MHWQMVAAGRTRRQEQKEIGAGKDRRPEQAEAGGRSRQVAGGRNRKM